MLSGLSNIVLNLLGWKIKGDYPNDIKKKVVIVVPHTSNWDFPLGLLFRSALKAKIHFIGKESLFKAPHGFMFRILGGFPVRRDQNYNQVAQIVDYFNKLDEFSLAIAAEGTRKRVERLKTGFYHIAKQAGVPIVMMKLNGAEKILEIHDPFYPGEDKDADLAYIDEYYKGTIGLKAENSYF